jgi:rhodanese-related sulfurtransferase
VIAPALGHAGVEVMMCPPRRRVMSGTAAETPLVHDLDPDEVARGVDAGRMVIVDVREPNETMLETFPGAILLPLSGFDPADIPDPEGRQVVFACRSGKRSVTASLMAQAAGLPYDRHLAGGILAWKNFGLPTVS